MVAVAAVAAMAAAVEVAVALHMPAAAAALMPVSALLVPVSAALVPVSAVLVPVSVALADAHSMYRTVPQLYSKLAASQELRKMLNLGRTDDGNSISRLSDAELVQQLADIAKELGVDVKLDYSFAASSSSSPSPPRDVTETGSSVAQLPSATEKADG